jgi:Clp amino terminal domain, pathogenicity island component
MTNGDAPSPTPRYGRVLAAAADIARDMHHSHLGAEHLFLAILRDRGAVPTQVLAGLTDLDGVEASLLQVMTSESYAGKPPDDAVWLDASELPALLPALATCVGPDTRWGFNVVGERAWIRLGEPANTAAAVTAARAIAERDRP